MVAATWLLAVSMTVLWLWELKTKTASWRVRRRLRRDETGGNGGDKLKGGAIEDSHESGGAIGGVSDVAISSGVIEGYLA